MNNLQTIDTQTQLATVKTNNQLTAIMKQSESWKQFMRRLPQVQQNNIPNEIFAYVSMHADTVASLDSNEFMARVVDCYSQGYSLVDGDAYILPFWNGKEKRMSATLIPGYIGIKRKAMETGLFKYFTVARVYAESIKGYDYRREVPIFDETYIPKGTEKVVGYLGFYEMFSGAIQEIYCSVEQLERHAIKFSPQSRKANTLTGLWKDNFDAMCLKTMYRKLGKLAPKTKSPTGKEQDFYESLTDETEVDATYNENEYEVVETARSEEDLRCENCNSIITEKVYSYSKEKLGKALCYNCQKQV